MPQTQSIFSPRYLALSIGIILAVMAVGFEGMAVTTVAPAIAGDLNGIHLYGWIFSAFLLAQIIGTLVVGRQIDRKGPILPFTIGLVLFVVGLILAAVAENMIILIVSRGLQGFGSGALMTCVYTAISLSYPDEIRSKILATFGTAYVLPAMIGPYVAGIVARQLSWRFVFWGILPILLVAALLSLPSFRKIKTLGVQGGDGAGDTWLAILLAIGTGLFLSGLGNLPELMGIVLLVIGLAIMAQPLRKLLPKGTLVFNRGLPAILASRGLFIAAYLSSQSFLVLAMTDIQGIAAETAGLAVACSSLTWSATLYFQARWDASDQGRGRDKRIILGVSLMVIGFAIVFAGLGVHIVLSVIGQMIAAIGIGFAHPTSSTVAFANTAPEGAGKVSANLQFVDSFTVGIVIGIGGAIVAINQVMGISMNFGIIEIMIFNMVLILMSLLASTRARSGKGVSQRVGGIS